MIPSKSTILLVDDEVALLRSVTVALSMFGYEVLSATDGDSALQLVVDNSDAKISAIVLDKTMPGMDGLTVLKKLKKIESIKGVPIIIASGYITPVENSEFKSFGAYTCIEKPYSIQTLLDILKAGMHPS